LIVDKILELCQFYAISVPKTFKQAMKSPEKDTWSKAISIELNNLEQMRVWLVRLMPAEKKALNGQWVFKTKPDVDGTGIRFKARFVAKGFTQVSGVDFNETFVALLVLLSIAAANKWPVHSFDFVAAYLNSPIDKEVWVKPPEGLDVPPGHALLLQKALYGTRQAAASERSTGQTRLYSFTVRQQPLHPATPSATRSDLAPCRQWCGDGVN
jgi:hypothetical protein